MPILGYTISLEELGLEFAFEVDYEVTSEGCSEEFCARHGWTSGEAPSFAINDIQYEHCFLGELLVESSDQWRDAVVTTLWEQVESDSDHDLYQEIAKHFQTERVSNE